MTGCSSLLTLCVGILAGAAAQAQAASSPDGARVGAREQAALEARLVAPCCWKQTLDVHESELASALRAEIRQRLARGEAAAAIESDLVARFGERLRAVPAGRDPRVVASLGFGAALLLSAAGLLALGRAWIRRSPIAATRDRGEPAEETEYGDRLDDELREFDDA